MLGTPNHGSEMARFRVFSEMRELLVEFLKGEGHILSGLIDGVGQAEQDLLPESEFLTDLNSRPIPEDIEMTIIAGVVSMWDENLISILEENRAKAPEFITEESLKMIQSITLSMRNGLGDGLVTVDSTRIDGVKHQLVKGNHLSMIRNVFQDSQRTPPAIPYVVEFLGDARLEE